MVYFLLPPIFNENNEPLIFSINPENISRIRLYRKTNMNKAIRIYLNAKTLLKDSYRERSISLYSKTELSTEKD